MCRNVLFSQMEYSRIPLNVFRERYAELEQKAEEADGPQALLEVFCARYAIDDLLTNKSLCQLYYDMDRTDPFWREEQRYWDSIFPELNALCARLSGKLLASPYRAALDAYAGRPAMAILENDCRGFDGRQTPLLEEENRLTARYGELMAEATVLWEGKRIPRSLMPPSAWESQDRAVRRKAAEAIGDSWESQRREIEQLYDNLVQNRIKQARLADVPGYVELSYLRMNRVGYDAQDVRVFREEVKEYLSPLYAKQERRRAEQPGQERLCCCAGGSPSPDGSPRPQDDSAALLKCARELFHRISPETGAFIDFLLDHELYDVEPRRGKRGGGYMMPLEKYRCPFLFVNFDGTDEDAHLLSHEGGHAFQLWLTREDPVREHGWLTFETAETHAMSMEFFAAPHMELFFGERAEDYREKQLETAVMRIAYQCQQDEFQELIYRNPELSPAERNALWLRLAEEYLPGRAPSPVQNLRSGCGWQRIPHIFYWPFYAIDYALAQTAALEYRFWMEREPKAAWQSYLKFCSLGGSMGFRQLLGAVGLDDPFAAGSLKRLAQSLHV